MSPNVRIRVPDHFEIGEGSVVDDWCYFSTRVKIGVGTHIANNVSISGGPERQFTIGDYTGLASGVHVYCESNNYADDLIAINLDGGSPLIGDVTIGNYTGVGTNSIIMPGVILPEGCAVGALSFVPAFAELEPWTLYAGIPVRAIQVRNRERVLSQVPPRPS